MKKVMFILIVLATSIALHYVVTAIAFKPFVDGVEPLYYLVLIITATLLVDRIWKY